MRADARSILLKIGISGGKKSAIDKQFVVLYAKGNWAVSAHILQVYHAN
jgi:hypothetical protein